MGAIIQAPDNFCLENALSAAEHVERAPSEVESGFSSELTPLDTCDEATDEVDELSDCDGSSPPPSFYQFPPSPVFHYDSDADDDNDDDDRLSQLTGKARRNYKARLRQRAQRSEDRKKENAPYPHRSRRMVQAVESPVRVLQDGETILVASKPCWVGTRRPTIPTDQLTVDILVREYGMTHIEWNGL